MLDILKVDYPYEVQVLKHSEALKLFSQSLKIS